MADLNARIIAKASGTASEEPLASDLEVAELAVNTADGKLFTKHTDGSVVTISGGGGTSATAVAPSAGVNVPDQSDISLALNMSAYSGSSVVSVDSYATTWNLVGNATFTTSWARFPGGALDTTSGGHIEPDVGTTLSEQFDGDFTIALWINKASNNDGPIFDFRHNDSIFCWLETNGSLIAGVGSSGNSISSSVLSNGDHHIAIVRSGTTIRLYVDGVLEGSRVVDPVENVFFIDSSPKTIGAYFSAPALYFDGYIADFVIANGHAVWSAAFTPPTSNVDYFQETGALPLPNGSVGDLAYNSQNGDYYYATSGSSWDKVVAHSSTLAPTNGQAIVWNASSGAWEFGSSQGLLGDLPDVDTSTNPPTDGQVLAWDNAAAQWEPTTPASSLVSSVNGQTGAVDLALSDINDVDTGTTSNGHLMDSKETNSSTSQWTTPYDGKYYRAAGDAVFRFAKTDANGTDFESQITSLAAGDYFEIEYSSGYIASFTLTGAAVTVDLNNYYVILSAPSAAEQTAINASNSVLIRSNKFSYNGLSNGQVLTYDSTQGRWEAADPVLSETATTWSVTASGSDHYVFSGDGFTGAETDPVLYVVRGQTYKISNTMNAHPFQIQRTSGISGVAYSDGITNNGVSNGTLEWEVRLDAPSTLYYQCTQHAAMGGTIQVLENPSGGAISDLGDVGDVLDYNEFTSIGSWNSEIVAIDTGGNDFPDAQGEWSIYESTTAGTSYLMINKTTSAGADYTSLLDLVVANPTDYSFKIKVNGGDQSSVVALTAAVLQADDRYRLSFYTAHLDPADYNEGGYSSSNSSTGGNGPYVNVLELDLRLSSLYSIVADGSVLTWNATNGYWEPAAAGGGGGGGGGATTIDDLTDVDTSTVAPADGQILAWDNVAAKWKPATGSSGGAVASVNGQTGVVSLGLTGLDDVSEAPVAAGYFMDDKESNFPNSWSTPFDGKFYRQSGDPAFSFAKTNSNGYDFESEILSLQSGDSFEIEYSSGYTASFTLTGPAAAQNGSYYVAVGSPSAAELTAFANSTSVVLRSNRFTAALTLPPADGQVLTWVDANNQWEPSTPSGGAVDSVNGETGVVSLGVPDLNDVKSPGVTQTTWTMISSAAASSSMPSASGYIVQGGVAVHPTSLQADRQTEMRAWIATLSTPFTLDMVVNGNNISATCDSISDNSDNSGAFNPNFLFTFEPDLAQEPAVGGTISFPAFDTYYTNNYVPYATDGQVLTWVDANSQWEPGTVAAGSLASLDDIGDVQYATLSGANANTLTNKQGNLSTPNAQEWVYFNEVNGSDAFIAWNTTSVDASELANIALNSAVTFRASGVSDHVTTCSQVPAPNGAYPNSYYMRIADDWPQAWLNLPAGTAATIFNSAFGTTTLDPADGQTLIWDAVERQWEPADAPVKSDTAVAGTGSSSVSNIVTISQVDYDALATPDAGTLYFIV